MPLFTSLDVSHRLRIGVDVDEVVVDSLLAEELLRALAVPAPRRAVHRDVCVAHDAASNRSSAARAEPEASYQGKCANDSPGPPWSSSTRDPEPWTQPISSPPGTAARKSRRVISGIVWAVTHPDIWLMRHGTTAWSMSGRHTGRTDIPLTDEGRAAARRLGEELAQQTFAAVFSSPMQRALETCVLAGLGDVAVVDDDLREWDYGDYEGRTTAEIRSERPDWTIWRDGCPGGETAADVGARADRVVARLREYDGELAVFGHGHCLRVITARWVGLAPEAGALLALDTATVSRLGWEREQAVVRTWNSGPET